MAALCQPVGGAGRGDGRVGRGLVPDGLYRFRFCRLTDGAGEGLNAVGGAGRGFCDGPLVPLVLGRLDHGLRLERFAANGTVAALCQPVGGAGRGDGRVGRGLVPDGLYRFRFCRLTDGAGEGLNAVGGAGRGFCDGPLVPLVLGRLDHGLRLERFAANGTVASLCQPVGGAGRGDGRVGHRSVVPAAALRGGPVGLFRDGIVGNERLAQKCVRRVVVGKAVFPDQKILIGLRSVVPRDVDIVVSAFQPDDVPCVGADALAVVGGAGDDARVQPRLQRHAVEQAGVALTDRGPVDQRGVGGVFQHVGAVVQIGVVVFRRIADKVVDRADLLIFALPVQVQRAQRCGDGFRRLGLLRGVGVVVRRYGDVVADERIERGIAEAVAAAVLRDMGGQIVALVSLAGMGEDGRFYLIPQGVEVGAEVFAVQFANLVRVCPVREGKRRFPFQHTGAEIRRRRGGIGKNGRLGQRRQRGAEQQAERQQQGKDWLRLFHTDPPGFRIITFYIFRMILIVSGRAGLHTYIA